MGSFWIVGHRDARSARSLRPLLEYLREVGAAPLPGQQRVAGPVEVMLADYASYLGHERGLAVLTIQRDTDLVRPFLAARVVNGLLGLESLTAADVTAFILARTQSASPATVQRTGTALRSLLRFLHLQGVIGSSLVGAVPTVANWKLVGLLKYLTAEQVGVLLAFCDLVTAVERRDLAILTLLARLGLRAGEVAALRLGDIDWRCGEITVRGEGNRHERLPLPTDVGEALVAYLRACWQMVTPIVDLAFGCRRYGTESTHREGSGLLAVAGYSSIIRSPSHTRHDTPP
jgi:integrase/recombinase XerD